jgi:light-regulated signal transduction histidine kinase (bacteriophytochrome)
MLWLHIPYLDSIFLNLFTNAIKYKTAKMRLLDGYEKDGYSVINFRDNGLGLDLKKMDTNFWNVQNLSW